MKLYKTKKSNIHRRGLSAAKDIKEGTKIIQYKGKKITNKESEENKKYGYDITYLFTLNKKYLLDGDFKYNTARLVNHSCNPNCEVLDNNGSEIWISAIRNIKKMKNLLMIMVLVSIVTTKIMYANVVQIIVLDILSEKDLDGGYKNLLS